MKLSIKILMSLLIALAIMPTISYAQNIRVTGVVRGNNGERIPGVSITDLGNQRVVGLTDDDGKYSIILSPNATVQFSCMGYSSLKEKIKGRLTIDVELESTANQMEEIVVTANIISTIIFEPSEIEVVGNYFHLRTRYKVPASMMAGDRRLVVQPTIYNVTRKKTFFLRPVVLDGREYLLTQNRMYGFDISRDTLSPYIQKSQMSRQGEIIAYHDSAYIENSRDDYRADVFMSVEDYKKILNVDTISIAHGTVNPLRFFDYNLGARDLTDSAYIPKPELQLRNDKGEVHLTYLPGKSQIDESDPENVRQLEMLRRRITALETNPDARLESVVISGISSPDGNYNSNVVLAKERMAISRDIILSYVSPERREFLTVESDSKVESWEPVYDMMVRDSLNEQAAQLRDIIDRYPGNPDRQFAHISKLPYYRTIIVPKYLPELRRVEYNFGYSIYRVLTDEEIAELYKKDYSTFSRYEFYRMFMMAKDDIERETLYKQALEMYPRFMLAANNLAALYIKQGRSDENILKPFINEKAPEEVLSNQIVAYLDRWKYDSADSVSMLMKETATSEYIKSVTNALNGNYEEAMRTFGSQGGINEVVLLLAMKRNEEAWEKAQELPDESARVMYVKAIIANRLDKVVEAINYIEMALEMDPSLREIAEVDADVKDLL
ncbi:MAG: carboxypeptidase-like regulatory domain-containing protein [Bacteroidetes bacterium]|uniref:Carboxypeptidase-like regulatory domain-containing protein n=1 Tax=Candidatus Caccoplasma merdipullorum TaxID=2840718 RepID=A0A9D9E5G4_9BACT|nr:carboxypeptidase-like regulatory domain-containing protein [Candidatus Caccoplasma merdipullorum]